MTTVCYRKSDLQLVGTTPDNISPIDEIELNVIPNFGGIVDDYAFIETDETDFHIELINGVVTVVKNELPLDQSKINKIEELKQQCEATIIGGYQSTVVLTSTGKAHLYPTDRDDQTNLNASATAAQLKPAGTLIEFKTKDAGYVDHTQDEIKAVSIEVYEHVLANLKRVNDLGAQVTACSTVEEVQAIVW